MAFPNCCRVEKGNLDKGRNSGEVPLWPKPSPSIHHWQRTASKGLHYPQNNLLISPIRSQSPLSHSREPFVFVTLVSVSLTVNLL